MNSIKKPTQPKKIMFAFRIEFITETEKEISDYTVKSPIDNITAVYICNKHNPGHIAIPGHFKELLKIENLNENSIIKDMKFQLHK